MNQRIAFAAMAMLLAAHTFSPMTSPEAVAVAGAYVAAAPGTADTYRLTLGTDASATLETVPASGAATSAERGAWFLEGSTVQLALTRDGNENATAATLEVRDGALVAAAAGAETSRFAGLTFTKVDAPPVEIPNN